VHIAPIAFDAACPSCPVPLLAFPVGLPFSMEELTPVFRELDTDNSGETEQQHPTVTAALVWWRPR
jgi:hypothetical protein